MKKLIFTISVLTILFSCEKDNIEPKTVSTETPECNCGEIAEIGYTMSDGEFVYHAVIYNGCSANDTTVNYIPQTNAGDDKGAGDPHCLGVSW